MLKNKYAIEMIHAFEFHKRHKCYYKKLDLKEQIFFEDLES